MTELIIGIMGGTGHQGKGIARRILKNTNLTVMIGSRQKEKAQRIVSEEFSEYGSRIIPAHNSELKDSDLIFLTIPYNRAEEMLTPYSNWMKEKIIVDCMNSVDFSSGIPMWKPPKEGSMTQMLIERMGFPRTLASLKAIGAKILNSDRRIEQDVFVAGDDVEAKKILIDILKSFPLNDVVDIGSASSAHYLEAVATLAIQLSLQKRKGVVGFKVIYQ